MKKILLPLTLSLLIIVALIAIATPKKTGEPTVTAPVSTPTAQEESKNLDKLAEEAAKNGNGSLESTGSLAQTGSSMTTSTGTVSSSAGTLAESGTTDGSVMCTDEYAPVCGTDKNTYPNACAASRMKVDSIPGACPKDGVVEEGSEAGNPGNEGETPTSQTETATLTGTSAMPTVTGSGLPYENAGLGYGFILPKSSYFSGFGPRDGASHSVGIGRNASPESFELSEVKIRFYKGKVLSQLQNAENGFYEDADNGITYLSISGSTLTVEADRSVSGRIVDSIIASAYVR